MSLKLNIDVRILGSSNRQVSSQSNGQAKGLHQQNETDDGSKLLPVRGEIHGELSHSLLFVHKTAVCIKCCR